MPDTSNVEPLCDIWPSVCPELIRRFWAKVDMSPREASACWEWLGNTDTSRGGYGRFRFKGKRWRASRVAYAIGRPSLVGDRVIIHNCKNARCCRPSHLSLGDKSDLTQSNLRTGRHAVGERVPNARLTTKDVLAIVALGKKGLTQSRIATRFGVHKATVGDILTGRKWRHVTKGLLND